MVFGESPLFDRCGTPPDPDRGQLLLHRALADVEIEPATVRFTSAAGPVVTDGYHPGSPAWLVPLVAEARRVQPHVLVLLGSSVGRALLGARFAPRRQRGCLLPAPSGLGLDCGPAVLVTAQPNTVQRSRHRAFDYSALVQDLRVVADRVLTT